MSPSSPINATLPATRPIQSAHRHTLTNVCHTYTSHRTRFIFKLAFHHLSSKESSSINAIPLQPIFINSIQTIRTAETRIGDHHSKLVFTTPQTRIQPKIRIHTRHLNSTSKSQIVLFDLATHLQAARYPVIPHPHISIQSVITLASHPLPITHANQSSIPVITQRMTIKLTIIHYIPHK